MDAYKELTEYIEKHKTIINDVARKIDHREDIPAEDVLIYVGFKQLDALEQMEAEERAAETEARIKIEAERCEKEMEHSKNTFDALVTKSLEWFENVK